MSTQQMISILHVLSAALSARMPLPFFDRATAFVSYCLLFAQGRNIEIMRDIVPADLTRDTQQPRLLGNIESL